MNNMHLKFKLFLFIISIYVFFMLDSSFAEEGITRKYAYGYGASQGYSVVLHGEPGYYPLMNDEKYNILYPGYFVNDQENARIQSISGMHMQLSISKIGGGVKANLIISNRGRQSFFIFRGSLTPCGNNFLVISGNVKLDYLGGLKCNFGSDYDPANWVEIRKGEKLIFNVNLEKLYIFPVGKRKYEIGSLEYPFFDETLMAWKGIYERMFYLFSWTYDDNTIWNEMYLMPYISDIDGVSRDGINDIRGFLMGLGVENKEGPSFYIRSNKVVIDIDGNKIHGGLMDLDRGF